MGATFQHFKQNVVSDFDIPIVQMTYTTCITTLATPNRVQTSRWLEGPDLKCHVPQIDMFTSSS